MGPSRRSAVTPFEVMDIVARAKARQAAGGNVALLCVGEPGGGAPAPVRRAAAEALHGGGDLGYTEPRGLPALRAAIAEHYRTWYGVDVDPAAVVVTTGASIAFQVAVLAGLDHGARVALARPGYPAYRTVLGALGCEVVDVDAGASRSFHLTTAALEEAHARGPLDAVVLASPANPTGTMVETAGMAALVAWCEARGVRLVSDEIYHGLTYRPTRGATAAGVGHAVVIGSFSKYWGMTGWRLGWLVLPEDLQEAGAALLSNLQLSAPTLAQLAALAAFDPESYAECDARRDALRLARDLVVARAPRLRWRDVAPPDGAFYVWADVTDTGLDSRAYCARLLADTGVALAPGTDFDVRDGVSRVRLSFSPGVAVVREACDAIEAWSRQRQRALG